MEKVHEKLKNLSENSPKVDKVSEEKLEEYGLSSTVHFVKPFFIAHVNKHLTDVKFDVKRMKTQYLSNFEVYTAKY